MRLLLIHEWWKVLERYKRTCGFRHWQVLMGEICALDCEKGEAGVSPRRIFAGKIRSLLV